MSLIEGRATYLLIGTICAVISLLLILTTPDPGSVDPPQQDWQDIPTCSNGGRSDCGSAAM